METLKVKLSDISSNGNIRGNITKESIIELSRSIEANGLFNPLLVKRAGEKYILIAGHRRFKAVEVLKWTEVQVVVLDEKESQNITAIQLIENIQRLDLDIFTEAKAVRQALLEQKLTYKDLSAIMGKSVKYIVERDRLNELIGAYKKLVEKGLMKISTAGVIARLTKEQQKQFLDEYGDDDWDMQEMKPEDVHEWIEYNLMNSLKNVPWDLKNATIIINKPCLTCKDNSANSTLFPELESKDPRCLDPQCFKLKRENFLCIALDKMKQSGTAYICITDKHGKDPELEKIAKKFGTDLWNSDRWRKYDAKAKVTKFVGLMMEGPSFGKTFDIMDETEIEMKKQQKAHEKSKEKESSNEPTPIGEKGDDGKTVDQRYWRRIELTKMNEFQDVLIEVVKSAMTMKYQYKLPDAAAGDLLRISKAFIDTLDYAELARIKDYTGIEFDSSYTIDLNKRMKNFEKKLDGSNDDLMTKMVLISIASRLATDAEHNYTNKWADEMINYADEIGVDVKAIKATIAVPYDEKREKYLDNFVTKNKRKPAKEK